MAVKYTWDCRTVETYPTQSDSMSPANTHNDVIHMIHYSMFGSEEVEGKTYSHNIIGSLDVDYSDLSDFTSFDSLTNKIITGWVTASLGTTVVADMKKSIKDNITEQKAPTSEIKYITS